MVENAIGILSLLQNMELFWTTMLHVVCLDATRECASMCSV